MSFIAVTEKADSVKAESLPIWGLKQSALKMMAEYGFTPEHISQRLKGELSALQIRGILVSGSERHRESLVKIFNAILPYGCTVSVQTDITITKPL